MVNNGFVQFRISSKGNRDEIKQIKDKIKEMKGRLETAVSESIVAVLNSNIAVSAYYNEIIRILVSMQENYWGGAGDIIKEEDKTQLTEENWGDAIRTEIVKNLNIAASSISKGNVLSLYIEPLSDEFLGIGSSPSSKDPTPIKWIGYFLIGTLDSKLMWVNEEVYTILKGHEPSESLGRFGTGYMWHLYPDEDKRISKRLAGYGISLSDLMHPQSGKPGNRGWFNSISSSSFFEQNIQQPALQMALSQFNKLISF